MLILNISYSSINKSSPIQKTKKHINKQVCDDWFIFKTCVLKGDLIKSRFFFTLQFKGQTLGHGLVSVPHMISVLQNQKTKIYKKKSVLNRDDKYKLKKNLSFVLY